MEDFKNGAMLDLRPDSEKELDYKFEEIVSSAATVNWVEKPKSDWRKFQIYNQDGSGSCVAQTGRKLLSIMYWLVSGKWVDLSASHIYKRRANKPQGGMGGNDVFQIMQKGTTENQYAPSDNMNDTQMDSVEVTPEEELIGKKYAIGNYLTVPVKDIDTIASIIQTTGKGVMVWFYWKYDEWLDVPEVKHTNLNLYAADTCRHSVCAVDFTLYNGEKALIIDDSWDKVATALDGQRVITESFFKERNFFAAYPMNFRYDQKHVFTKTLKFNPKFFVDEEVKALQDILKKQGLFPSNVDTTGYFGAITLKAVKQFQTKYNLKPDGIVGPKTNEVLNTL